jgi:hypothetical protein
MNMRNYADQKHNVPRKGRGTLCFQRLMCLSLQFPI